MKYPDGTEAKAGDLVLCRMPNSEGKFDLEVIGILTTAKRPNEIDGDVVLERVLSRYTSELGRTGWIVGRGDGLDVFLQNCSKLQGVGE